MHELVVCFRGRKVFSLALNKQNFTVGRSEKCDLILTGENISRCHVLLRQQGEGVLVHDQSRHGTWLNGKRIESPQMLRHKNLIEIAEWRLEFLETETKPAPEDPVEITKSLQDTGHTKLIRFDEVEKQVKIFKPMLLITEASGRLSHKAFRKDQVIVGSASDCDVVLADDCVSRRHVRFEVTHRGLLCRDLDSSNGTWVDGGRVVEKILLDQDEIKVGNSRIRVRLTEEGGQHDAGQNGEIFCGLVGKSPAMKNLFARIAKVAPNNMPVFIQGESGTGKEKVARAVHDLSLRKDRPFVVINCGAISASLVESELFGHEKGAFTGADLRHAGVFEQAHGGTLFLDEIGELPLELQAKILRVLECQTLRRVGGEADIVADVRVVAATHQNLKKMVARETFRADLFYRLFVLTLNIPPLRERSSDIPHLVKHMMSQQPGWSRLGLEPAALDKLARHNWPGNVRELKNTIFKAACFSNGQLIREDNIELVTIFRQTEDSEKQKEVLENEARKIEEAIIQTGGNKEQAAELLGVGRSTLFRRIKELRIEGLVA